MLKARGGDTRARAAHCGTREYHATSIRTFHFPSLCFRQTAIKAPKEVADAPVQIPVAVAMVPDSAMVTFSVRHLIAKFG